MRNFVFGYAHVSTEQQCLDCQLDMLEKYGVDKIYNAKMTGTKRSRPELEKMLERLTETGKLIFTLMSALAQFERDVLADRTRANILPKKSTNLQACEKPRSINTFE